MSETYVIEDPRTFVATHHDTDDTFLVEYSGEEAPLVIPSNEEVVSPLIRGALDYLAGFGNPTSITHMKVNNVPGSPDFGLVKYLNKDGLEITARRFDKDGNLTNRVLVTVISNKETE